MINLLSDSYKRDIQAARMNVILLRYNLFLFLGVGLLVILCLIFLFILRNNQSSAISLSNDYSQKAASYEAVRIEADQYRSDLDIASKILNRGTNYSSLIFGITKILPPGVVLNAIDLNASSVGQQVSFTASSRTFALATELKNKFQSSDLFCNVYFQNISDASSGPNGGNVIDSGYPITITISVLLKKAGQKC